jgi:hypothetical protein
MGYTDFDWPQDSQLFPKHETVTQYLEDYAADIKNLILRKKTVKTHGL